MHNKLLFKDDTERLSVSKIKNVPIDVIQKLTSEAMSIHIDMMYLHDRQPGARKREYVTMRQISMALAKEFTKMSLDAIGNVHGGRDHATTLHAVKTVHNLIDSKDMDMTKSYKDALKLIRDWIDKRNGEMFKRNVKQLRKHKRNLEYSLADTILQLNTMLNKPDINKFNHLKILIRNRVPLEIRQQILEGYGATYKMF